MADAWRDAGEVERLEIDAPAGDAARDDLIASRFGRVTLYTRAPADGDKRNVTAVTPAAGRLERLRASSYVRGVALDTPPGVPMFRADPDNPQLVLRVLDGKEERGTVRDGRFVAL